MSNCILSVAILALGSFLGSFLMQVYINNRKV